jgi:hypothetical protein
MRLPLDWKRNVNSKMSNVARTLFLSMQQDQMPNDIVGAAEFFASKATSFIIGHTLVAEGGASSGHFQSVACTRRTSAIRRSAAGWR